MPDARKAREEILKAAEQIILQEGVKKLTIEGVAIAAGISKGGIFYHFPSKDALIQGMIERLRTMFQQMLDHEVASDPEPYGRFTRAYARAPLRMTPEASAMTTALIAGLANDRAFLQPLLDLLEEWAQRTEAELDITTATLVRLTIHGLWFNGLFGAYTPEGEEVHKVIERLVALTRPTQ